MPPSLSAKFVAHLAEPFPIPSSGSPAPIHGDGAIPDLEGLDSKDGLMRLGENRPLYLKLLRQFLTLEDVPAQLADSLARGDWPEAELLAHTVKGMAAGLGAYAVQRRAAELERELRKRTDSATLARWLGEFQSTLSDFIERLRVALPREVAPEAPTVAVDPEKAALLLVEIHALLVDFDVAATELFEANQALFRALLGEGKFSAFEKQIANFAFADARDTLRQAAEEMEIPLP